MSRISLPIVAALALVVHGCSRTGEQPAASDHDAHDDSAEVTRVNLTEAAWATAGIEVVMVGTDTVRPVQELTVPGQVEFDPRRVVIVSPRIAARVESLAVVEGDNVTAGQPVALLYSPAWVTAQGDLLQALRRSRLLAGTPDDSGARAIAEAARRRLVQLGAARSVIQEIESTGQEQPLLALHATISGTIMEAHVLAGQSIEAGQQLFRLADLSVVDVVAAVPERSLPLVRVGQVAQIELAAYPELRFAGRVERLRGELNPETRTVEAVIHAVNQRGRLRPGMFASVRLAVSVGAPAGRGAAVGMLTVPARAVVSEGERRYVFVEVGPRTYERRQVETVSLSPPGSVRPEGALVGIRSGLIAGEQLVVAGAFTLKSELAKSRLGDAH